MTTFLCRYICLYFSYTDAILRVDRQLKFGPHHPETIQPPRPRVPAEPRSPAFWLSSAGHQASPSREQEEGAKRRREDGYQHVQQQTFPGYSWEDGSQAIERICLGTSTFDLRLNQKRNGS